MRTISQFVFRFVTIRSRSKATLIALSLPLGFALWSLGCNVKVKAAATRPMEAASGFLYVLNDCRFCGNKIFGFAVDETTGALTPLSSVGFPILTGGNGRGNSFASELLTIDRKILRLFAINDDSNTVSAYRIDPVTGALTALSFSPIALPSTPIDNISHWSTIAVHPSGSDSLLVVGDIGSTDVANDRLASFKVTATTATPAVGSPFSTGLAHPLSTAFSQDGNFVYTGGGLATKMAGFRRIDANGALAPLSGSAFEAGDTPSGYATDAERRLFVVNRPFSRPRVFTTANGGIPEPVSDLAITGAGTAGQGVLHPKGTFYMVSEILASGVSVFKINGNGNATTFTRVNGSPFTSGGVRVRLLALNQAGTFLFAANSGQKSLTTFTVDGAGVLAIRVTQPDNTLGQQGELNGIAYLPPFITTTTIQAPEIIFGQNGSVIVTVSSLAGSPSGNVSLTVDKGTAIEQHLFQALFGGSATFIIFQPKVGVHSLEASFAQSGFTSSSATGTLVVKAAPTTTTISARAITLGFPTIGQTAPVIVTVSSPFVSPSGIVRLRLDGGAALTLPFSGGLATFNLVAPNAGSHSLKASFDAQGGFAASNSSGTLVVNPIPVPVLTTMKISARAVTLGQDASIIVSVSSACGIPSGNVTLKVDGVAAGTKVLYGGKATFIINKPIGSHSLFARFTGTDRFAPSRAIGTLLIKQGRFHR